MYILYCNFNFSFPHDQINACPFASLKGGCLTVRIILKNYKYVLDFIIFIGRINYKYYSHEQLNQVMNVKPNLDRIVIGYYRVSSNKQKDELERQIENMKLYLTAQGKRANKARKLVKELIDDGGEEDDKNNSSHADPK